ncbi:tRNA1(Val) (adenine(37)-N6)-methyltransferase [Sporolactobacillus shoreicorticis]|uniref:tRNA1(Val) (Adenine(37)-N6)-methyltransferase n=1 Tax=Sporolactobacillus shoreicorticis TaxID=1923877 RepID=A0ABW5S7Y5_9BACL|nr:tRNA1(Val) (adenine(37)-N6)-methyltransferase [Sporolactobacillus shoreicorticis]MCO7127714.1 tRNA1(Val) (adenine(37)-N6)-methyltransferase [Sporolactobacillus shoreicorticis]
MSEQKINSNERIDYLFDTDLKIIQSSDLFPFSLDSVLLARFVYVPIQKGRLVDLCAGNGVIAFLLSRRTKGRLTGVEIQPEVCALAKRGAVLNHLEQRVDFLCADAKRIDEKIGRGTCDVVTCNPPYFTIDEARDMKRNRHLAIARHELLITLADVLSVSARLLKPGGKLALVHRPERLADILAGMRAEGIEPKRMRFVHPHRHKPANMVLVEGTKGGKPGLSVLAPIVVCHSDGSYTEDVWPHS